MLSEAATQQLEQQLEGLLDRCQAISAAVVVTVDGYTCAMKQRVPNQYSLERVATMGSTLMSLGDTMTAELKMGRCENIISENQHGIVAFMHINHNLVLVSLTKETNSLGMLLSHSRKCAESMSNIMNS
jgi:predicted regulator of Ras-like GTPase activity (Roadblock/LC7/MglB family)